MVLSMLAVTSGGAILGAAVTARHRAQAAADIGVDYYGEGRKKGGGAADVTEYPSIEELPESLGDADAVTYTLEPDGSVPEAVQYVLDSKLWPNLPAVQQGRTFGVRYTEAATYGSALRTLDELDAVLAPLLG